MVHQTQTSTQSHYPAAVKKDRLPVCALYVHHWSTRFSGLVKSMYHILPTSFAAKQEMTIRLHLYQITHFAISLVRVIWGKVMEILSSILNRCAGVCKRMNAGVAFRKTHQLRCYVSTHSNLPSMTHSLR